MEKPPHKNKIKESLTFLKKVLVKNTKELHGSPLIWLRRKERNVNRYGYFGVYLLKQFLHHQMV